MATKKTNGKKSVSGGKLNKYDRRHLNNLTAVQRQIQAAFYDTIDEVARLGIKNVRDLRPDKAFSFSSYPTLSKRFDSLLSGLSSSLTSVIVNGVRSAWTLSNDKNDELSRQVFGSNVGKLSQSQYRRYFTNNGAALDAFLQRKTDGLNLSDRVWRYTDAFRAEIETGLDVGIRNGVSAQEMTRDLRQWLQHPDMLFRRVRDAEGNLNLSRRAAAFHPGQGVYRSSYMNARRLAATETNMAYRTADHLRWQQQDFVVGIRIVLSNNHTCLGRNGKPQAFTDICDELSAPLGSTNTGGRGCYPKDFKFTGWHPHCRCHAESILKTPEEMAADNQRILDGEDVSDTSVNTVADVPKEFSDWVRKNESRITGAAKDPYFISDNRQRVTDIINQKEDVSEKRERLTWDEVLKEYDCDYSRIDKDFAQTFDFGGVKQDLNAILDRHGITLIRSYITDTGWMEDEWDKAFTVHYSGKGFSLERVFWHDINGNVGVEHELFKIDKEYQGKGLSKEIFRMFYKQYQAMGVTRMNVHANIDVGGYTWARYGFCLNGGESKAMRFVKSIERKFDSLGLDINKVTGFIADYYKDKDSASPFPMNKLVDFLGKDTAKRLLFSSSWFGSIDLTNAEQRRVFEKYLGL